MMVSTSLWRWLMAATVSVVLATPSALAAAQPPGQPAPLVAQRQEGSTSLPPPSSTLVAPPPTVAVAVTTGTPTATTTTAAGGPGSTRPLTQTGIAQETTTTSSSSSTPVPAEPPTTQAPAGEREAPVEQELQQENRVKETATTQARPATTLRVTTTVGPRSSLVAPSSVTTQPSEDSGGNREQRVVWIVVGALCVVGLLIATLTWRYWWFTDPKRGYVRSRAVMSQKALRNDPDSEVLRVWQDGQMVDPPQVPVPGSPRLPSDPVKRS